MSFLEIAIGLMLAMQASGDTAAGTLEARLRTEETAALARDARRLGDALRGASAFYQPSLTCTKCHTTETGAPSLGPDLTALGKDVADAYLVEAILEPSKVIKKGYETVTISTEDGRTVSGLLGEDRADAVVIRDPGQDGKAVTVRKDQIEERKDGGASIMPAGLVNNLGTRQQFLDLVRYLMEIAEKGPARALELKPDPALLAVTPLPESERDIDHAGLISSLNRQSFERGEAIYNRVCINCHGTKDRLGSLPTSLRFASGVFKNGADPFSMYRTLTLGFGQMTPQGWMVPRQKYDVIHYIREAYPEAAIIPASMDASIRRTWRGCRKGKSRGAEPVEIQPWVTMDYGPSLMATYEISKRRRLEPREQGDRDPARSRARRGFSRPGLGGLRPGYDAVRCRLDGIRGSSTGTASTSMVPTRFIPELLGRVELSNPNEPAWANPGNGSFVDLRERGRDGLYYGPLPRPWVHYRGFYQHADRMVLSYTVGQAEILEAPGLEHDPTFHDRPIFTRTLNIGRSPHELRLRVAPEGTAVALAAGARQGDVRLLPRDGSIMLLVPAAATPLKIKLLMAGGEPARLERIAHNLEPPQSLSELTRGGPTRWPERLPARAVIGRDDGPFAVDLLPVPQSNPWLCQLRLSGFDFLADGRSAVGLHVGWRCLAGRGSRSSREGAHHGGGSPRDCSSRWASRSSMRRSTSAAVTRSSASATLMEMAKPTFMKTSTTITR